MTTLQEIAAAITAKLQDEENPQLHAAKAAMGQRLIELVEEAYRRKSTGGPDITGERWKKTKKFEKLGGRMLIESGRLLHGFRCEVTQDGFRIVNDTSYAPKQLGQRSAWPSIFPEEWRRELLAIARPFVSQIVISAVRTKYPTAIIPVANATAAR